MPNNDRTKTRDPRNLNLDDLVSPQLDQPLATQDKNSPTIKQAPEKTPDLSRATSAQTRAATANITHTDQMRDLMSRMRDIGDDEISDEEAARRAGYAQGQGAASTAGVRPVNPENLPAVQNTLPTTVKQDLANISQDIKTRDGKVYPKWNEINNLPGYMQRAIRAMGRGMFKMFTNTNLEDIITIANVGGQGPNSNLEMQAVANWLQKNAEDLGASEIDFSQVMPGYNPEVKEYRTETTRFHVVRDPFGVYIYAYPEQDAIEYSSQPAIGSDDERDEFGAPIKKRLKEKTMTTNTNDIKKLIEWIDQLGTPEQERVAATPAVTTPVTSATTVDQIKWHRALLEDIQADATLDHYADQILQEFIEETEELDEGSTLIPILKDVPGGEQMAQYLHRHDKVSASAEWDKVPSGDRVQLKLFKASPDYHMVIVGKNGIASAKPDLADFTAKAARRGPTWKGDNTLLYQVIAWSGDQRVDNMLIPDEYEYELNAQGEETDKVKKERVWDDNKQKYIDKPVVKVNNSKLRQRGILNPNSPPTIITIKRAGRPFQKEPGGEQNFFDMLKGAIGNVSNVYIATSKIGNLPRRDIASWIKDYKAGLIPPPDKNDGQKYIASPKSAEIGTKKSAAKVWDPEQKKWVWPAGTERVPAGARTSGASARELVGAREKAKKEFTPGQFSKYADTPQGVAMALRPVIDKFMHTKFAELKDRIARYTAAENDDAAGKAVALRKNIREIATALDTTNPNWNSLPLIKLAAVIDQSVGEMAGEGEDKKELMRQISQLRAPVVQQWWSTFKRTLDKTDVFSK